MTARWCCAAALVLLIAGCARVPSPGTAGATAGTIRGITAVDSLLQAEVDQRNIAGAAVLIVHDDEVLHRRAYGYAQSQVFDGTPLDEPDILTPDHLFDLASLTKVFATTFGIMMLVDRGEVDLDTPVAAYFPEFSGKDSVTIRHLLTHTSGLTPWEPIYYHASNAREARAYVASRPLVYPVGTERSYSDLGFMTLGYVIKEVSGRPLDVFLRENLYEPLGLENTMFTPLEHGVDPDRIAATSHGNPFERKMVYDDDFGYRVDVDPASWDGWRRYTLRGEVNDGNAFYAHGGVAGHAGLFSTLDDLRVLVDLLLHEGEFGGEAFISPDVIREFLTPDAFGNGLGWAMDSAFIQARGAPEGTFGHTGFTGTNVVVVPALDLSVILLTNRQQVGPRIDGSYHNLGPTRQQLTDIVLREVKG